MEKNAEDIIKEIKQIDNNFNAVIVPMLKDTVSDKEKTISKLIVIIVLLIVAITGISIYSQITLSQQQNKFNEFSNEMINKYNDFLSQFEFSSEVYQDLDTTDNSTLNVNSGIDYK